MPSRVLIVWPITCRGCVRSGPIVVQPELRASLPVGTFPRYRDSRTRRAPIPPPADRRLRLDPILGMNDAPIALTLDDGGLGRGDSDLHGDPAVGGTVFDLLANLGDRRLRTGGGNGIALVSALGPGQARGRAVAGLHQPTLERSGNGLCPVAKSEFHQDATEMGLDGRFSDK